jgi:hypothetical protein
MTIGRDGLASIVSHFDSVDARDGVRRKSAATRMRDGVERGKEGAVTPGTNGRDRASRLRMTVPS